MLRATMLALLFAISGVSLAQQPQPQQSQAAAPRQIDIESMVRAALEVAKMVDGERAGEVWDGSSAVSKRAATRENFIAQIASDRKKLGAAGAREWATISRQNVQAGDTLPAGRYISVSFATTFTGNQTVRELVSFRLDEDGIWRVAGYSLR